MKLTRRLEYENQLSYMYVAFTPETTNLFEKMTSCRIYNVSLRK